MGEEEKGGNQDARFTLVTTWLEKGNEGESVEKGLDPEKISRLDKIQRDRDRHELDQKERRGRYRLALAYAVGIFLILAGQLVAMDTAFFMLGTGRLELPAYTMHTFIVGTLAEIVAIVLVVTRNLFPNHRRDDPPG